MVGPFISHADEGVRLVASHLAREVAKYHEITTINVKDPKLWWKIQRFKPQIIHYILSPTIWGLLMAKATSFTLPKAKTVVSAPHPATLTHWRLVSLLKPDLTLTQAQDSDQKFRQHGYATRILTNGVDVERFKPVGINTKKELRAKYGLDQESFIVLHVGPLRAWRNLRLFKALQGDGVQILIIGRTHEAGEKDLLADLTEAGCLIWNRYIDNMPDIYNLADCYLFPAVDRRSCIDTPLSVLEAMACNLPVISTKFGALTYILGQGGDGLIFMDNQEREFRNALQLLRTSHNSVNTRDKVLSLSWLKIGEELERIYQNLCS